MKDFLEQAVQRRSGRCAVSPISDVFHSIGELFSLHSAPAAATPAAPPTPGEAAPPVQQPIGSQKSGSQGSTPSFVGSAAVPATGYGQKSLLGQ